MNREEGRAMTWTMEPVLYEEFSPFISAANRPGDAPQPPPSSVHGGEPLAHEPRRGPRDDLDHGTGAIRGIFSIHIRGEQAGRRAAAAAELGSWRGAPSP